MLLEDNADLTPFTAPGLPATVAVSPGAGVTVDHDTDGLWVLSVDAGPGDDVRVALSVPLGTAEGYWYPRAGTPVLMADWAGTDRCHLTASSPIGCLYDHTGRSLLGFAADTLVDECLLRFGVSEEDKTFVVLYQGHLRDGRPLRLALVDGSVPLAVALPRLRAWQGTRLEGTARPVPESARTPVYSTWYAFSQNIDAVSVEANAEVAATFGCRTVFIDDGWQEGAHDRGYGGCGEWRADPVTFPDFAAHVDRLHALDQQVVVWIAPLLLGVDSPAHDRLAPYAPHQVEHLRMRVLDPRFAQTREHLVSSCLAILDDYGADGLKIDFLDTSSAYADTPSAGDLDDVGEAMRQAMAELRDELARRGFGDALIELRQPYVGPAMSQFGNVIRAGDCPADAVTNRFSTVNARMIAGPQVVHADPIMWDPTGGPVSAARQLMGAYFGVPQISMELTDLPTEQRDTVTHLLGHWRRTRDVVLDGELDGGLPSQVYPVVRAWRSDPEHGDRGVIGVYADTVVDLERRDVAELTLLNATPRGSATLRVPTAQRLRLTCTEPTGRTVHHADVELSGLVEVTVPSGGVAVLRRSPS